MFCSGVIAEYNPFHNGHMHHLRETINIAGNPNVIARDERQLCAKGGAGVV